MKNNLGKILLLILPVLIYISCVIAPQELDTHVRDDYYINGKNIVVAPIVDSREDVDIGYFPNGPNELYNSIKKSLISMDFNVISRDHLKEIMEEQNLQMTGITDNIGEIGKIGNAEYLLIAEIHEYSYSDLSFSIEIIDIKTGEIILGADYSDSEPLWVPISFSSYHPTKQMKKAIRKIFNEFTLKIN